MQQLLACRVPRCPPASVFSVTGVLCLHSNVHRELARPGLLPFSVTAGCIGDTLGMLELCTRAPFLPPSPGQYKLSLSLTGHGRHFPTARGGSAAGPMLGDCSVSGGLLSSLLFPPADTVPLRFVLSGALSLSRAIC